MSKIAVISTALFFLSDPSMDLFVNSTFIMRLIAHVFVRMFWKKCDNNDSTHYQSGKTLLEVFTIVFIYLPNLYETKIVKQTNKQTA